MQPILNSKPVKRLTRPLRARLKSVVTRVAREQVATLRAELDEGRRKVQDAGTRVEEMRSVIASLQRESDRSALRVGDLTGEVAKVSGSLGELVNQQHDFASGQAAVDDRMRELTSLVDAYRCSLDLVLGPTGRYAPRFISDDELQDLLLELEFVGDRDRVIVGLHQAYRTLIDLELRSVGRVAGGTPNILAKLAAVALMPPPSGDALEIGTLFGAGAVGVARQISRSGIEPYLTIVDPFAGYQMQPDRDDSIDVSLSPVTQAVVVTNLALGGVSPNNYRLIEGTSDSPESQRVAGDRSYGLIVIDGDHSEKVAYNDLLWAESIALPDALVILDDFDDPAWPGVAVALKRYIDRPESTLRLVGTAATTAFLRQKRETST